MAEKDIVVLDWPDALAALEQNGAQPADDKNIKDSDGKTIDNGWSWTVGRGYLKDAIKAGSLEQMVDMILGGLAAGDCIKSLALAGHGAPGTIAVGDGTRWKDGKHIDGNRPEWEPQLSKLCGKFCTDAAEIQILLLGCETGVCENGAKKLYELATFFKGCAKSVKGKFTVYGTKRASAEDVEDAIRKGRRDHLVSVSSDADAVPGCLTTPTTGGVQKKDQKDQKDQKKLKPVEKPQRSPQQELRTPMTQAFPVPDPREFVAIGFRDLRTRAGQRSPVAALSPQPISVPGFLALYDFSQAYEPTGIPSRTDGEAILFRADGTTLQLDVSLDYKGLEYQVGGERYLYFLRNLADRRIVKDLLATGRLREGC